MDADDLLRESVSAAVDEVLADPLLDPEREVERLQSLVSSMFWTTYQERKLEEPAVEEDDDDNTTACRTCGEAYAEAGDGWDGQCPDCADRRANAEEV